MLVSCDKLQHLLIGGKAVFSGRPKIEAIIIVLPEMPKIVILLTL